MAMMTAHQKIFAVLLSLIIFGMILELVRRRRLREEYATLWLLTGAAMVVLVVWERLLLGLTEMIGAVMASTTLFLFSWLFLLAIVIHYSVIISRLTTQVKNLAQELAILTAHVEGGGPRSGG
ncbi:MAG TPA: DUF2304 domain-containing protein [Vicinamibacteria bacterium]|nr:DUF2304 domain-containing protein [Vicinamibacteria bacterium]